MYIFVIYECSCWCTDVFLTIVLIDMYECFQMFPTVCMCFLVICYCVYVLYPLCVLFFLMNKTLSISFSRLEEITCLHGHFLYTTLKVKGISSV